MRETGVEWVPTREKRIKGYTEGFDKLKSHSK